MNAQKLIQNEFFSRGICSNPKCMLTFSLDKSSRCPICDEPSFLPSYEYFNKYIHPKSFEMSNNRTSLTHNKVLSHWSDVNLYIKEEQYNPSGSFKDRGTATAIQFLFKKVDNYSKDLIIGTVSTGNMAISTAMAANKASIKSFIVVSSSTPAKKIQAIQKAGGNSTTIFVVYGDYANFHQNVYQACNKLQAMNINAYAQLTDDVYRIVGYASLFEEIIRQLAEIDILVLPVASGALFRVAAWTLEGLHEQGVIKQIPTIVLVQEDGADPIVNAYVKNLSKIERLSLKKGIIADGINISYSRSGNPVLEKLKEGYHKCISVTADEIQKAQHLLSNQNIFVENASATSIAAVKKLRSNNQILPKKNVVCVLTGGNIESRQFNNQDNKNIISCTLNELQNQIISNYKDASSYQWGYL